MENSLPLDPMITRPAFTPWRDAKLCGTAKKHSSYIMALDWSAESTCTNPTLEMMNLYSGKEMKMAPFGLVLV
jgi:hypothetical protein